jgi:thioredoxin 1
MRILNILSSFLVLFLSFSSCKKEPLVDTSLNNIPDIQNLQDVQDTTKIGVSMLFFHNTWCKRCEEIRPTVEAIAVKTEFATVFFGEVEYDKHKDIAEHFNVKSFPVIILIKNGKEQKRFEGKNHTQEAIENALRELK